MLSDFFELERELADQLILLKEHFELCAFSFKEIYLI